MTPTSLTAVIVPHGRRVCTRCRGFAYHGKGVCERCVMRQNARTRAAHFRRKSLRLVPAPPPVAPMVFQGHPSPVPAPQARNEGEVARRVLCKRYDGCLDQAIESRWQGFSCDQCSIRDEFGFADVVAEMRARLDRYEVHSRGAV